MEKKKGMNDDNEKIGEVYLITFHHYQHCFIVHEIN